MEAIVQSRCNISIVLKKLMYLQKRKHISLRITKSYRVMDKKQGNLLYYHLCFQININT